MSDRFVIVSKSGHLEGQSPKFLSINMAGVATSLLFFPRQYLLFTLLYESHFQKSVVPITNSRKNGSNESSALLPTGWP